MTRVSTDPSLPAAPVAARAGLRLGPMRRRAGSLLAALLATLLFSGQAFAAPDWMRGAGDPMEPTNLVRPPGISLEQAANMVRRETGGRVLSASPAERGGQRGYEVRVLVDGKRVKSYFVDGEGRMRSRD